MVIKTTTVLITLAASSLAAWAQDTGGFTLRADAGVAFVEDFEVGDSKLTFDPGFRFDIVPTYHLNQYVSFDFNTGFIWNNTDKIEGPGGSVSVEGDQWQFPFLLEATARFPLKYGLTPFIGGGGGGVYAIANVDKIGGDRVDETDDDVFGAVQGVAGLEYRINEKFQVGLVYKYLHMFTKETIHLPGEDVENDNTRTHSISLSVRVSY